jgi:hypothetical protein
MPWPVHPTGFFGARGDSDTYRIERSLRFNSADSAFLNRTPSSATSRTVWTLSCWVKRSALTSNYTIFSAGTSAVTKIAFEADAAGNGDSIRVFDYDGASFNGHKITTALYRDTSSWYHIVVAWNTAEAAADRIKIYVNGSQVTSFSTNTNAGTGSTSVNNNVLHRIGQRSDAASGYFNGYMAEIHLIDGQALTPASFGETDAITGRWKAKAYSGTYGTNGFYLKFADNSGTTSTTLGKDSSGNGNNWTPNNFSVTAGAGNDSLVDSPTNYGADTGVGGNVRGNYATLNPLDIGPTSALANGNLDFSSSNNANYSICRSTIGVSSGKWYWEILVNSAASANAVGIANGSASLSQYLGQNANGWSYYSDGQKYNNASGTAYGSSFTTNDIIGVALDMDNGTLVFYKNNSSQGTAFTGLSGTMFAAVSDASSVSTANLICNFGQRPFAYTAPSGFKALCTQNLPQPTIQKPSKYMDALAYTGTGASNSISSLGFSPDLVWIKNRGTTTDHAIYDTTRGTQAQLSSNTTGDEATSSTGLTSFDVNGFTIGTSTLVNTSGTQYVAWSWDESVQAGMDIVSYTGNGANRTIAHNLGVAPKMIIVKARTTASTDQGWPVWHTSIANTTYLTLSTTSATATGTDYWNSTSPTSSVFSLGTSVAVNANNDTYISYLFAEIEGYSKFGSYTGNGSSDGPFVWCGFRPRWVMIKRTDVSTENWMIKDSERGLTNPTQNNLYSNLSNAEQTTGTDRYIDFISNGIKIRATNIGVNEVNGTYIFAAFAESPFKYARAR